MPDDLLEHYNQELTYIKRLAADFAKAHPGVAENLRISSSRVDDPHVSRLIEAFAYLNARTRQKIEDDFPEITEAYLSTLYPHYLAPFPPTAIMKFKLDRGQAELTSGYTIDRKASVLTEPIDGEPCRFQTCYPVTVYPMDVADAEFCGPVAPYPKVDFLSPVKSFVRLGLETYSEKINFSEFQFQPLRFYLKGHGPYMHQLYEFLLNGALGVGVAKSSNDQDAVTLPASCIQQVGFERDEGLIDYSSRSFVGYRLLSDFFVLPEKYLFFEVNGLTPELLSRLGVGSRLELYFYLDRESRELEHNVSADTFQLGCCPISNLFEKRAEPIHLSHQQSEYRIVVDERLPTHFEIHSVDQVTAVSPQGDQIEFLPFYSIRHEAGSQNSRRFYCTTRRPAIHSGGGDDRGTEMYLNLVDLDFRPIEADDWTLNVRTTCLNRDLPSQFDFGGGQPRLQLETGGPLEPLQCLTAPTDTMRPELGHGTRWKLISHLTLGHLSILDSQDGAEALREILRLYNPSRAIESSSAIEGLLSVKSQRAVGHVGGSVSGGFCRGTEITLGFDEEKYVGRGLFLFASLLERFLALYSSINSFTKTIAVTNRREEPLKVWPPRAGEKQLL